MRWWSLIVACCVWWGGCFEDYALPNNSGSLGGRVMLSGGVRGARVTVDQLDPHTGLVYQHVGAAVTDQQDGSFLIPETREASGLFQLVARGGTYTELATGATIELDATDEIRTLLWFPIVDRRDDALVGPIGHIVDARAWARFAVLGDLAAAVEESTRLLHTHFGRANWSLLRLHDLSRPATSPTEPVRAAFVHAALSYLVRDIALEAEATPQTINVFTLMKQWAADIVPTSEADPGLFDGNDGNDRAPGSGLRLGLCEVPIAPGCVAPPAGCDTGYCRPLCDLYVGTARSLVAGAMIKVIRDGAVNRTGLTVEDLLGVARAVSDDPAPELFGGACIEKLDRTRPELSWDASTPAADKVIRRGISMRAIGSDDVDPKPRVEIVGYPDIDGDLSNSAALAALDTIGLPDGDLYVTARATDLSGNTATIERRYVVDNTAPQLTLAATDFFVDGATWWTASAAPVLTGSATDVHPVSIKAVIAGGPEVAGVVAGGTWTIALPAGSLAPGGTSVQIVATDVAGNQSAVTRLLRPDVEPPALSFQSSTVLDEADEWVTFAADHSPQHAHVGMPVELSSSMTCPSVTKFSNLLGSTTPEYTTELPGPNPLRYQLLTEDPGVGIAAGSTQYRVGRRTSVLQTIWLQDWTSAGAGSPLGASMTRFPVGVFSSLVAGLDATEGTYDVEFRATDRLGRTTTTLRCFDLHLRAPPLEFEATSTAAPTKHHRYALDSLSLAPGAQYDQLGAGLLNHDATGASLIDQDIFNGTTSTIYLTVRVTRPEFVMMIQSFVVKNAVTDVAPATCGDGCIAAEGAEPFISTKISYEDHYAPFPAKVFALVGGEPATEIPCLAPCPLTGTVFRFAIPPRASGGQPARAFRVMTMLGQSVGLFPRDGGHLAYPPFEDTSITWTNPDNGATYSTRLTGIVDRNYDPARRGCVKTMNTPNGPVCTHEGTLVPYQALRTAELTFSEHTLTVYETSATAGTPSADIVERLRETISTWSTAEGVLP